MVHIAPRTWEALSEACFCWAASPCDALCSDAPLPALLSAWDVAELLSAPPSDWLLTIATFLAWLLLLIETLPAVGVALRQVLIIRDAGISPHRCR